MLRFDNDYYQEVIRKHHYDPMDFNPIDFDLNQINSRNLQYKWLCHYQGNAFSKAIHDNKKCIVTTGIGLSGVPHLGTLSQILRAIFLQKNGLKVQIVLGDLDSYNARNQPLEVVLERAEMYKEFIKKLGFDDTKGILRSQYNNEEILKTAYLISKVLKDKDFKEAEEDLSELYQKKGIYPGIEFPVKQAILLMTADFIPFKEKCEINSKYPVISLSGSGKKGIKTINISTTSAIVAVSLGANVIKPCSIATSSMSGSYDFLEMIGVNTNLNIEGTQRLLKQTGFGIFPIEKLIPKFDKVYGDVFYAPNILSYALASLICPLKPDIVLYGLANKDIEICGKILKNFGINKYRIISSKYDKIYFMDELNVFGTSYIIDDNKTKKEIYDFEKLLVLPHYNVDDIKQSNNKTENIKIALNVLRGNDNSAYEDIVALNAGNILQLSGITNTIKDGYSMAKSKIKTGQCIKKLEDIIISSNGNIDKLRKLIEG